MASAARRVGRTLVIAFTSVVAVAVGGYLVVHVVDRVEASRERGRLEDLSTRRLVTALPQVERELARAGRTIGRSPDASWVEQSCRFSTDDGGWTVNSYRETCDVVAVGLWDTDGPEAAASLVRRTPDPSAGQPCVGLGDEAPRTTYVPARTDLRTEGWCAGLYSAAHGRRLVSGDVVEDTGSRGRLVVVSSRPLLDVPIGCARASLIFCSNPFGDEHAFGRPPTS